MGRVWRIEYEGALYPILSRGNEQKDIFYDNPDRLLFLKTIGEMSECFEIDVFTYVLMGNYNQNGKANEIFSIFYTLIWQ